MKFGRLHGGIIRSQQETAPSNFILNPSPVKDTTGWSLYSDAAGTAPVDGTGGSVNTGTEINWSRTTSSPLSETASFLFSKIAASSMQGKGVSYDFTVNSADKSKVHTINFDYEVASGTYADGDLTVWIYDVTNGGPPIQPSASSILNGIGPQQKQTLSFQTNSNSTSYRLIIHCASTSAVAYTVKFDNFQVSRQSTAGVFTVAARYSTAAGQSIPNGGSDNIINFGDKSFDTLNAVTTGASWKFTAPVSGIHEVSSLLTFTSGGGWTNGEEAQLSLYKNGVFYTYMALYVAPATHTGRVVLNGTTRVQLNAGDYIDVRIYQGSGAALTLLNSGNINYVDIARIDEGIPAQDAETRVVAAKATLSGSQTVSSSAITKVTFNQTDFNTDGAFDTTNNRFIVKTPGIYDVAGSLRLAGVNTSEFFSIYIFKNGSNVYRMDEYTDTTSVFLEGGSSFSAVAGDYFEIHVQSSGDASYIVEASASSTVATFSKKSGPAQIAASEEVNAKRFSSSTAAVYNSATTVAWTTSDYDSHNGFGTSSVYTVKTPGKYQVVAKVHLASVSASAVERIMYVQIRQNGTVKAYSPYDRAYSTTGREYTQLAITTLNCIAGDTIDIQVFQNLVTSTNVNNNGGGVAENFVTIDRIG